MSDIIFEVWMSPEGDLFAINYDECFELGEDCEGWEWLGDL